MERPNVTPLVVIHTLVSRFLILVLMIVFAIPTFIFVVIPASWREHKFWYWMMHLFYVAAIKISFLPVTIVGKENIPTTPAVIAANHQSSLDIPLVGLTLNTVPHIWLATSELLDSPILRFVVPRVAILIDMTSPITGMRSLINAIRYINGYKKHAIIFPEAARFTDGKIHDFYMGFVILAKKTGRPVVPMRIYNLEKVYPPKCFWIFWHPIKIVIGKPMTQQPDELDEQFKDRVMAWFISQGD